MKTQTPLTIKRWTLLTSAGWGLGILLVFGLAILVETLIKFEGEGSQCGIGIGMGAGVGFMQWIALRKHIPSALNWLWFSILGFSLSYISFDIVGGYSELKAETVLPFATALGALLSGWFQYNYMLKNISLKAKSWIIINPLAWTLAHLATMSILMIDNPVFKGLPGIVIFLIVFTLMLIGGPLLGILTGWSIVSLLKKE